MDWLKELNAALVQPIAGDIKDAYWMQRAARERYPMANAALNFVPYVGIATNADDLAQHVAEGNGAGAAGDVAEAGIGLGTLRAYTGQAQALARLGQSISSTSGGKVMGLASMGPMAYLAHVFREQDQANRKYDGMDLKGLSDMLRYGQPVQPEQKK